ncbi:Protein CBG26742 [Caenorhabditis briggsae]|uniref:Protein CBG26742 n=1 Tax=Caenorhabditis briggsae TaxID=6238 RepID=B6IEB7_CAEBR|nr:Protein CBG26742 [Caenorhabditis briggsae]CAS01181.1 Protein CBG26742 [Caenorhabditis briggsae]
MNAQSYLPVTVQARTRPFFQAAEPPTNVLVHFIECQQARRGDALRRRCAPYAPYMPHTGVLSLYPIHRRVLRRPSIMCMRAHDL